MCLWAEVFILEVLLERLRVLGVEGIYFFGL
jgi:hypothetical protein